jgi:hypothetical protein
MKAALFQLRNHALPLASIKIFTDRLISKAMEGWLIIGQRYP